jgi:ADP-ribose pyrophosphatase YjhB (NUDIX family)
MSRRYCDRCGAPVVVEERDGHPREICSQCATVFYRNPLPVAASVVLDEQRRVLLVRRKHEPHAGAWCLPTGFAEIGETIEAAALRELGEEAGLEGRITRLLTARSIEDEFYGDLLFITFEVGATGGSPAAGDDAAEVEWFPLSGVPPLAFAAHEEAIRVCEALHREPWAIQDSFARLYSDDAEGMLSDALVALVEDRAGEITERWVAAVRGHPTTPRYARTDITVARATTLEALTHFCDWLQEARPGEAAAFYRRVGEDRRRQGYPLEEVLSALTLLRREIWAFAREHQVLADPIDVYRVMELSRRIVLFFDKALFEAAKGYREAG